MIACVIATPLLRGVSVPNVSKDDREFLEDLQRRSIQYFWEQASPDTGLVPDRASVNGGPPSGPSANIASSAATGFGLTALCIGAAHGWMPVKDAQAQVLRTLQFFANHAVQEHGWFYHWMDIRTGERRWNSEVSSIDTALLLGGVLTAGQYFSQDTEIAKLAAMIYDRVDFAWMLNGDGVMLSHGWQPDKGFLKYRWDTYAEMAMLYLLGIGSATHPIPPQCWHGWARPLYTYGPYHFISGGPLFTHQYSHAWIDFRNRRDRGFIDFFANSKAATQANRLYCQSLVKTFPDSFQGDVWGITASDGVHGYKIYGEIQHFEPVDGTVAPCAAGGSLMFTPELSMSALRAIRGRFGDRVWGRYGFVDAFNAGLNWFDTDVIGIDVGITLLSAENLLTGNVWKWCLQHPAVLRGLNLAGFEPRIEPPPVSARKPVRGSRKP